MDRNRQWSFQARDAIFYLEVNIIMNEKDTVDIFINPYYAITVSPDLTIDHEPMVTEDKWVSVNLKIMEEIGNEEWLKRLLKVLKAHSEPSATK